jgi:hypothetical protein
MFRGFVDGPFSSLQSLTKAYVSKFGKILSISGAIFDADMDGLADNISSQRQTSQHSAAEELNETTTNVNVTPPPTHIFRILVRCEDGLWHVDGTRCKHLDSTRILTFVLPNVEVDLNSLVFNIHDIFGIILTNF